MFETERLKFKVLDSKYKEDLERLFCENHLVMKSTLKGRVFTQEEFKTLINNHFINSKHDKVGLWCLTSHKDNKLIGVSGLLKCDYVNRVAYEFGFILNDKHWGKGLATEIGQFWLNMAKKDMHLTELLAMVSPDNKASRNVLEKLNMTCVDEVMTKERGSRLIYKKDL